MADDKARIAELEEQLAAAEEALESERAGKSELVEQVEGLTAENEQLKGSLRAQKGQATRARSEVQRLQTPREAPTRNAGPLKSDDDTEARRTRIWEASAEGDLTLVFSDGKREIRELGTLTFGGDRFADRGAARGIVLDHEPVLEPGEMSKPEVAIAGFALFDAGGKQIGWSELPEPVRVPRGGRVKIPANSIRF